MVDAARLLNVVDGIRACVSAGRYFRAFVARIADAVTVRVDLFEVGRFEAIVAVVPNAIAIGVLGFRAVVGQGVARIATSVFIGVFLIGVAQPGAIVLRVIDPVSVEIVWIESFTIFGVGIEWANVTGIARTVFVEVGLQATVKRTCGVEMFGQLSPASAMPSPSASPAAGPWV